MKIKNIIVGAGISGCILARRIAEEKNEEVLIIERKSHIGGYCFDYRNQEGILVHQYGPHIFRTDSALVWNYLSRFTDWHHYQHKVLAFVQGKYYPMPINLDTVNSFLGTAYSAENVNEYFEKNRITIKEIRNVKDAVVSQIGSLFYENFFKNYTQKQWGEKPENLPKEIVARIPIRANRDDRYFAVKYQAMPLDGYTAMIQNILAHKNIRILLNTDYFSIEEELQYDKLYYSGSVDEFFKYQYGKLPYRCVNFEIINVDKEWVQPAAVVNYPNDYDYTRVTEYKHFYDYQTKRSVIAREYSSDRGEPSYPIPKVENMELYQKYLALNKDDKITFIGRLGEYKYYSMDQIVKKMLEKQLQ